MVFVPNLLYNLNNNLKTEVSDNGELYSPNNCHNQYLNKLQDKNKNRVQKARNGVKNIQNLKELKIIGINQLQKEITELKHVSNKKID